MAASYVRSQVLDAQTHLATAERILSQEIPAGQGQAEESLEVAANQAASALASVCKALRHIPEEEGPTC